MASMESVRIVLMVSWAIAWSDFCFSKVEMAILILLLVSFHPETPSPLAGEGWGEGELK
jgi:hypothetical protein